jgi:deazaflavin-dependent oxidoreductase (nitroreductase family)
MEPRIPKYVPVTNVVVKLFTRLGVKTGPVNVITVAGRKSGQPRSTPVTPWEVDGKRYVIAGIGTSDWARNARAAGEGTLTSGRTTTRVWLTEVTDPALKERVVTSFGTENRAGGSFLVQIGVAPDRTPKGFAAAVPLVAVFEVTPRPGAAR